MSKTNENTFHYYKLRPLKSELLLEFEHLDEFIRFVRTHKLYTIYQLLGSDNDITHFATSYKGGLLQQLNHGYETLEDYSTAKQQGFENAKDYYTALNLGYTSAFDYNVVQQSGIEDKLIFEEIKNKGFVDGFQQLQNLNDAEILQKIGTYENTKQLYDQAIQEGYTNYNTFYTARLAGFTSANQYKLAKEQGFEIAQEYQQSISLGFLNYAEYKIAQEKGFYDREDMRKSFDLDELKELATFHDQRLLINLISKMPQGKKVSIHKIQPLLQEAMRHYHWAHTQQLAPWFTIGLNTIDDISTFLINNKTIHSFGAYFADGEYIETKKIIDRKIVIDGSNVAHNSMGKADSKPSIVNLQRMVTTLQKLGFEDIIVISDASLKHRLTDASLLPDLQKQCTYLEAPAGNTADIFIINFIKKHNCLLISNDIFKDWKKMDPWVALNIDYYRMSFMITNDAVLLPDLE